MSCSFEFLTNRYYSETYTNRSFNFLERYRSLNQLAHIKITPIAYSRYVKFSTAQCTTTVMLLCVLLSLIVGAFVVFDKQLFYK